MPSGAWLSIFADPDLRKGNRLRRELVPPSATPASSNLRRAGDWTSFWFLFSSFPGLLLSGMAGESNQAMSGDEQGQVLAFLSRECQPLTGAAHLPRINTGDIVGCRAKFLD